MEQRYEEKQWTLGSLSQSEIERFLAPIIANISSSALAKVTASLLQSDTKRMTAADVISSLSAHVLYIPNRDNNLRDVKRKRQLICAEFHDPLRSREKAWENIRLYARTSHLLLAQVMEEALLSKLTFASVLKSTVVVDTCTLFGETLAPQTPVHPSADGLLAAGHAADLSFRNALKEVIRECGFTSSRLLVAGVKGKDRVVEKTKESGLRIFDLNRATIVCEEEKEFELVSAKVFGQPLRFKNLFAVDWHDLASPPCFFFNLALPNCSLVEVAGGRWVVEVQVTLEVIIHTKELLHPFYEINRAIEPLRECPVCCPLATDNKNVAQVDRQLGVER